ncbi:hypothetical protein [Leptospira santarosai]|uniref:Uncharacterized protein n=1 Tax=Leptospira santarosai str. MOR084 TaxID=1049984 RepID=A0A0E2BGW7_9LEPT|nr:hypothetical protein [Leptospira santarosai]EKO34196.1 hypothetical protein LEP1GSC179_0698 [Leptospira santarosai str. MOR084]
MKKIEIKLSEKYSNLIKYGLQAKTSDEAIWPSRTFFYASLPLNLETGTDYEPFFRSLGENDD